MFLDCVNPTLSLTLQKFVCTTLRPTYLPYKELYEYDSCAGFVADYLMYEVMKKPNELVRARNDLVDPGGWLCFQFSFYAVVG